MASRSSKDAAFLLIGGYSLLGFLTDIEDEVESVLVPSMSLGDTWEESTDTGIRKASLKQEGFFDDATNTVNAELTGKLGISSVASYGFATNAIGQKFEGWAGAVMAKHDRMAKMGDIFKARAEYNVNGTVEQGLILHALGAETAAGNTQSTPVDNGASSANGGSAYLQFTGLTLGGYTSVTVKVRHSTDNITYNDLATFTAVTAAPAAERVTFAGTVNRYLASQWILNGAGAGPSMTFMVGAYRAP